MWSKLNPVSHRPFDFLPYVFVGVVRSRPTYVADRKQVQCSAIRQHGSDVTPRNTHYEVYGVSGRFRYTVRNKKYE